MAPPSNRRRMRWAFVVALVLALAALSAPALQHEATAAPGAKPPREDERKRRADAEFAAAAAALGAWCDALAAAEQAHPAELAWTLRRAQCVRMREGTEPAQALLAAAAARVGPAALSSAQATLDAELGATTDDPRRVEIEQHWKAACEHFAASLAAESSPGTQLAVASCHLRAGKLLAAAALTRAAQTTLEPLAAGDVDRAQQLTLALWLRQELERLQPSVTLRAHGGFSGSVQVAATELPPARALPLDPGQHTLSVKLSDATLIESSLTAAPAQRLELRIAPPRRALGTTRRILVWGGLGLGAASATTAGIMYWSAQNKWSALDRAGCTRSSSLGGSTICPASASESLASSYNRALDVFQISAAAAVVLLATATTAYLTAPRAEALRIIPLTDGERSGAALTGSF